MIALERLVRRPGQRLAATPSDQVMDREAVLRRKISVSPLLLAKCNLVTRGYLTSIHSVAVGQVQGCDRVVGE